MICSQQKEMLMLLSIVLVLGSIAILAAGLLRFT
jgi:hypothetical protein